MKRYIHIIMCAVAAAIAAAALTGCHDIEEYADDPQGNFE